MHIFNNNNQEWKDYNDFFKVLQITMFDAIRYNLRGLKT